MPLSFAIFSDTFEVPPHFEILHKGNYLEYPDKKVKSQRSDNFVPDSFHELFDHESLIHCYKVGDILIVVNSTDNTYILYRAI